MWLWCSYFFFFYWWQNNNLVTSGEFSPFVIHKMQRARSSTHHPSPGLFILIIKWHIFAIRPNPFSVIFPCLSGCKNITSLSLQARFSVLTSYSTVRMVTGSQQQDSAMKWEMLNFQGVTLCWLEFLIMYEKVTEESEWGAHAFPRGDMWLTALLNLL